MATNTTATSQNHNGTGSQNNFAISFAFLANTEVDVTVGGVLKTLGTHYNIVGSEVQFTSGNTPPSGTGNVKFTRDTNISTKKVDFTDGSVLTETDLDNNSDQILFAQQEMQNKLSGIEEGATADQTAAEIRTLTESASDSNVFTDADHSKLNAIEAGATADQTASEIRTLVESASDSNVFTDADHSKLNGIESGATADQTNAEIRAAVEAASDSNVFTDADHSKLNGIETGATADQTVSEIKSLIAGSPLNASHLAANSVDSSELVDGSIDHSHLSNDCVDGDNIADNSIGAEHLKANSVDSSELVDGSIDTSHLSADCVDGTKIADNAIGSEHLQANSVGTSEIADAELTTLAGMQSGTASKLADSTALTSDIADLNQLDGMAKQTTITDDDTKFPTSGAVVDYVAAQIAPIGGLEVIANEDSFPTTQPSSGVVISISDIEGLIVNGSGVATNARTSGNGSDNVTINGFPSSLQSKTMAAGLGLMVSSTGSSQTYTYHKLLAKEEDVEQLSNDINDFASRYRVGSSNPTSDNDAGDLFFNTSTNKLLVFNGTSNAYEEAQSVGNFFISTLSPAFDGSTQNFTVTNAPTNVQQIILSINGVVQKPNSGTSTPSEGFALDGSTIKLAAAPASGSDAFVIVMGSTVNIGTPSNNTVTSAILQNGSVQTAKLADQAVTLDKLLHGDSNSNGKFLRANNGADPTFETIDLTALSAANLTSGTIPDARFPATLPAINGANLTGINTDLVSDTSPQLGGDLQSNGNDIDFADDDKAIFGTGSDLSIRHSSSGNSLIDNTTGILYVRANDLRLADFASTKTYLKGISNGAVELYHNNSKKFETSNSGITVNGAALVGGNIEINADAYFKIGASNDLSLTHTGTDSYIQNVTGNLYITNDNGGTINLQTNGSENAVKCIENGSVELYHDGNLKLNTNATGVGITGNLTPVTNNTYDLGSTSYRWRNIYTNDLNLSNEGSSNDVDGSWGSYTIQEGAEDLFLINKRNGKKYKFNLTEVS